MQSWNGKNKIVVVIRLEHITNMKNELGYKEKLTTIYVDYKGLALA